MTERLMETYKFDKAIQKLDGVCDLLNNNEYYLDYLSVEKNRLNTVFSLQYAEKLIKSLMTNFGIKGINVNKSKYSKEFKFKKPYVTFSFTLHSKNELSEEEWISLARKKIESEEITLGWLVDHGGSLKISNVKEKGEIEIVKEDSENV